MRGVLAPVTVACKHLEGGCTLKLRPLVGHFLKHSRNVWQFPSTSIIHDRHHHYHHTSSSQSHPKNKLFQGSRYQDARRAYRPFCLERGIEIRPTTSPFMYYSRVVRMRLDTVARSSCFSLSVVATHTTLNYDMAQ